MLLECHVHLKMQGKWGEEGWQAVQAKGGGRQSCGGRWEGKGHVMRHSMSAWQGTHGKHRQGAWKEIEEGGVKGVRRKQKEGGRVCLRGRKVREGCLHFSHTVLKVFYAEGGSLMVAYRKHTH